mgnify:FL=1
MHRLPSNLTDPAQIRAYRMLHIPQALRHLAQRCASKLGQAEAWTWQGENGRLYAVAYMGRSLTPYNCSGGAGCAYYFRTEERRREWIAECFRRAAAWAERKAADKAQKAAARAAGHKLAVGDVLRASWGYDQTNIDYYQVTKLIGSTMVEYRPISCLSEETASMQGVCVPSPGSFTGEAKRAKVSTSGDSIKVSSCANAYKVVPHVVGGVQVFGADHWTAYA